MKRFLLLQTAMLGCLACPVSTGAAVRYVNVNSASPSSPYTNWTTAATVIQDAVDVALPGDEIVVTNGVYQVGGRAVYGTMTNRVAVTKPLTVRSVNGPEVTVVRGYQVPGMTNGPGAVRCVYLTNGAALVGFTLTNGATGWHQEGDDTRLDSGGGTWCESLTAVVSNCVLTGNSASIGGGASAGTLNNCVLTGNSALAGGGTAYSTLNNCTLSGNSAQYSGGGAYLGTLSNCTLTGNLAYLGGGAYYSTLNNCVVTGNSVPPVVESGNLTSFGAPLGAGGGVSSCTLNNCTLSGNSASFGGGAYDSTLNNCIVYYNAAARRGLNYSDGSLNYCCTTPLPSNGIGNITAEPELVSVSHIAATSPCRGAGSRAYVSGMDIDGEPWANPPSIGCDEVHHGSDTGPLTAAVQASFTNVATGFEVNFIAQISGHASASRWEFGDGTVVSNWPYADHAWLAPGDYPVVVRAYNQSFPGGISATVTVHVVEGAHYVAAASINPVAPYTSWATAANTVQDAVDVALPGAEIVVTNGVYQTGGRAVHGTMTNRMAVTKPLTVRSVNGPDVTVIRGYQVPGTTNGYAAVRCVYLTNGATIVGFTLTNGATLGSGGGVWCESPSAVVSSCVLSGNSAGVGGGAYDGTLNNCTLTGNSAQYDGGGAYRGTLNNCILTGNTALSGGGAADCTLNNCTLTGNSAQYDGGGAYDGRLNNCTVYYNNAKTGPNYYGGDLNYCCTTPLPPGGQGNFTNAPLFLNQAAGDLRLQPNSPCINAGLNAYAPAGPDFDGNPRIVGGTVDIGAYEFQSPQSTISYAWLLQYGLPIDGSTDLDDPDGDGHNNWQEWRAGTNPTNSLSVLRLLTPIAGTPRMVVRWQSVSGRNYFLERSTNLAAQPAFALFASNIVAQADTTAYTDTNAVGAGPFFYRVGVKE